MAHDEPPHQDLHCFQIQLFSSGVLEVLKCMGFSTSFMKRNSYHDTLVPPWKRRPSKRWSTLKIKNLLLQEQNSPLTVDPVEKEDSNEISRVPLSG